VSHLHVPAGASLSGGQAGCPRTFKDSGPDGQPQLFSPGTSVGAAAGPLTVLAAGVLPACETAAGAIPPMMMVPPRITAAPTEAITCLSSHLPACLLMLLAFRVSRSPRLSAVERKLLQAAFAALLAREGSPIEVSAKL
jgi:hypothetical protein